MAFNPSSASCNRNELPAPRQHCHLLSLLLSPLSLLLPAPLPPARCSLPWAERSAGHRGALLHGRAVPTSARSVPRRSPLLRNGSDSSLQ